MLYKEENPQEDPNKSYLHNQTFLDWLKKQYWLLISQVAVLAYILYFIASFAYYVTQGEYHEFLEPRTIQKAIYYTHIPILLLFIFGLIWIIKVNKKNYQKAREAYKRVFNKELDLIHAEHSENQLKRFKTWFLVFWIGMCALYITFTFQIDSWRSCKLI